MDNISAEDVEYKQYSNYEQLKLIKQMVDCELSEPYSIYTYRYFVMNYPNLTFLAYLKGECIGVIIGKLEDHQQRIRGYLGMIVVVQRYRRLKIGRKLVDLFLNELKQLNCDEVVLETESVNTAALRLYEQLGFTRDKRLQNYYMNGNDAFRLKLWINSQEQIDERISKNKNNDQQI